MTGRAEIYKGVPGAIPDMRGAARASRPLAPRVAAWGECLCPQVHARAGRCAVGRESAAGAVGGRLWGALSRARLTGWGSGGGHGASRGPGGEARAPRPSRALRACQFLETSRPGAGLGAGTARAPVLAPGPGVGREAGSGLRLFWLGSSSRRWAGRGDVQGDGNGKRGEPSNGPVLRPPPPFPGAASAPRALGGWPVRCLKFDYCWILS